MYRECATHPVGFSPQPGGASATVFPCSACEGTSPGISATCPRFQSKEAGRGQGPSLDRLTSEPGFLSSITTACHLFHAHRGAHPSLVGAPDLPVLDSSTFSSVGDLGSSVEAAPKQAVRATVGWFVLFRAWGLDVGLNSGAPGCVNLSEPPFPHL